MADTFDALEDGDWAPRPWIVRIFDPSNPSRFLTLTGVLSVVIAIVLLVIAINHPKTPIAYLGIVALTGLPCIWSLWLIVVIAAISTRLPAPTPLRDRNLLFAIFSWGVRLFWGITIIVVSGFVGGFIVEQLDSISNRYGKSADIVGESVALSDALFGWFEGIVSIAIVGMLYVLPVWLSIRTLMARTTGRAAAIAGLLRVDPLDLSLPREEWDEDWSKNYRARLNWVTHLSTATYPALFWAGSTLVFGLLVSASLSGIEEAHIAWDQWLRTHQP